MAKSVRFRPNPLHLRILAALPLEEPVALNLLIERAGLRLYELVIPLSELIREGYVLHESSPNERGGLDHRYTQLAIRATTSVEVIERDL
jgi:hypothetical protein